MISEHEFTNLEEVGFDCFEIAAEAWQDLNSRLTSSTDKPFYEDVINFNMLCEKVANECDKVVKDAFQLFRSAH